jgi:hypothetical protein
MAALREEFISVHEGPRRGLRMSTTIPAALALGGALRVALFGMRFVQSCVRFGFLRLFFVFMARARTADSVRSRVLLWHWRASFLNSSIIYRGQAGQGYSTSSQSFTVAFVPLRLRACLTISL